MRGKSINQVKFGMRKKFNKSRQEIIPEISVLMTIYKDKDYLSEAIKSILNQSFKNWEFIIIAEPETSEESLKIVRSFHDKRIRLIINETHLGFSSSLNKGIELARGKYIARMDADDVSLSNRLLLQWLYMETHADVILCGTNAYSINVKGKIIDKTNLPINSSEVKTWLYFKDVIFHPTVMFRRKQFIDNCFFYREQQAEDYELWTRVSLKCKIVNLRSVLLKRRLHGKNSIGKYRYEIQSADVNTQKNLWRAIGISINIKTPFYECDKLTSGEKKKRKLHIDKLEEKVPYFRGKKRVFKEIRNAYIGNSASL